jgi:mannose-6-phosphate isomerase-like protein (cupin superfamily)
MQLVVMSLKPEEEIPEEVHQDIEQFIRIERGKALVIIDNEKFELKDDDIVIIPSDTKHYVKNISEEDLKIYSIYTPAEHEDGTIHKTFEEALEDEEHHH